MQAIITLTNRQNGSAWNGVASSIVYAGYIDAAGIFYLWLGKLMSKVVQRTIVVTFSYQEIDGELEIMPPNMRHKEFVVRSEADNYEADQEQLDLAVRAHSSLNEWLNENGWPYNPPLTERDKEVARLVLDGEYDRQMKRIYGERRPE